MGVVLLSIGCGNECRDLCTAWYDYRRDFCGELDSDDERIRCLADYQESQVTSAALAECSERVQTLNALRDGNDSEAQAACCNWQDPACSPPANASSGSGSEGGS